jgi:hypothetical protein
MNVIYHLERRRLEMTWKSRGRGIFLYMSMVKTIVFHHKYHHRLFFLYQLAQGYSEITSSRTDPECELQTLPGSIYINSQSIPKAADYMWLLCRRLRRRRIERYVTNLKAIQLTLCSDMHCLMCQRSRLNMSWTRSSASNKPSTEHLSAKGRELRPSDRSFKWSFLMSRSWHGGM